MSTRRPDRDGVDETNSEKSSRSSWTDTVDGLVGMKCFFRVLDFPFFLRKKPCASKLLKTPIVPLPLMCEGSPRPQLGVNPNLMISGINRLT